MASSAADAGSGEFPHIWLEQATATEQAAIVSANSIEWKGALDSAAYARRESLLADQDLTRNGGITFWALKGRRAGADSSPVVLAACETLLKRGLFSHNGRVTDLAVHGVASVFGMPAFRGHGFGRRLIAELARALPSWKTPRGTASASVLYSDIGKTFYARHGWASFASAHMHLAPVEVSDAEMESLALYARDAQGGVQRELMPLPHVTQLVAEQIPALCAVDEMLVRRRLEARPAGACPAITVLGDERIMAWHHAREEFVAQQILGRTPLVKGALVHIPATTSTKVERYGADGQLVGESVRESTSGTSAEPRRVWAIWMRVYQNANASDARDNVLYILRVCIEPRHGADGAGAADEHDAEGDEAEIQALMAVVREAQRQAHVWNTEHVEVWNPSRRVATAVERLSYAADGALGVLDAARRVEDDAHVQCRTLHHREKDSITALQVFDEGKLLGDGFKATPDTIDWVDNEKFAWN